MDTAIRVARPGGSIGCVGVPHGRTQDAIDIMTMLFEQVGMRGDGGSYCEYMAKLMSDILAGTLDLAVFDRTVDLDGIPDGYAAMDEREALEVFVKM